MAAITLNQGNGGIMDRAAYPNLFDLTFNEQRLIQDKVAKQGLRFVADKTTKYIDLKAGDVSSVLGLPNVSNDTEKIRFVTPVMGHSKAFTTVQRRSGIIITKTAVETQVISELVSMMRGLPATADRVVEYSIADLWNNGFATHTGADGSYIFAADHTHEDPRAGAWTNLGAASAFSTTAYSLAWQNLQNRTNEKGFVDPYEVDSVVYPVALHEAVLKVLGSPKVAENALNGINVFMGDAKPQKWNYLTSSTAWFVHGKRMGAGQDEEGMWLVWRVRPEDATISDSMNPELIYGKRLRMAMTVGCFDSKNWYGNAGA